VGWPVSWLVSWPNRPQRPTDADSKNGWVLLPYLGFSRFGRQLGIHVGDLFRTQENQLVRQIRIARILQLREHLELEFSKQLDFLRFLTKARSSKIGFRFRSGAASARRATLMLLLRNALLGEVSVTVWPKILRDICAKKDFFVLE